MNHLCTGWATLLEAAPPLQEQPLPRDLGGMLGCRDGSAHDGDDPALVRATCQDEFGRVCPSLDRILRSWILFDHIGGNRCNSAQGGRVSSIVSFGAWTPARGELFEDPCSDSAIGAQLSVPRTVFGQIVVGHFVGASPYALKEYSTAVVRNVDGTLVVEREGHM